MKRKFFSIWIVCYLSVNFVLACSCTRYSFCEFYQLPETKIAFKAIVLNNKTYSSENFAVYLKIIKKYKEEIPITDTIKIFGGPNEASCQLDVRRFVDGDTLIGGVAIYSNEPVIDPDSLLENFLDLDPGGCGTWFFKPRNNWISGFIDDKIFEYPLDLFEEVLKKDECSFDFNFIQNHYCRSDEFYLYPNPTTNSIVELRGDFRYLEIERIRIFSPLGKLLDVLPFQKSYAGIEIKSENFVRGLNLIEINCSGRRIIKKLYRL